MRSSRTYAERRNVVDRGQARFPSLLDTDIHRTWCVWVVDRWWRSDSRSMPRVDTMHCYLSDCVGRVLSSVSTDETRSWTPRYWEYCRSSRRRTWEYRQRSSIYEREDQCHPWSVNEQWIERTILCQSKQGKEWTILLVARVEWVDNEYEESRRSLEDVFSTTSSLANPFAIMRSQRRQWCHGCSLLATTDHSPFSSPVRRCCRKLNDVISLPVEGGRKASTHWRRHSSAWSRQSSLKKNNSSRSYFSHVDFWKNRRDSASAFHLKQVSVRGNCDVEKNMISEQNRSQFVFTLRMSTGNASKGDFLLQQRITLFERWWMFCVEEKKKRLRMRKRVVRANRVLVSIEWLPLIDSVEFHLHSLQLISLVEVIIRSDTFLSHSLMHERPWSRSDHLLVKDSRTTTLKEPAQHAWTNDGKIFWHSRGR